MDELYTVNELSEKLKYSRSTIYRWVEEGSVPHHRMGRQIRFTENDVAGIVNQKDNVQKEDARYGNWYI
jgi:excisionase family DNA binding protein